MVVESTHGQTVLWSSVVAPLLYTRNSVRFHGGGMYTQSNSSVGFSGSNTFKRNSTMYAWSNCSVIFSGITPLLQRTQLYFMGVEYIWTVVILSSVLAPLYEELSLNSGGIFDRTTVMWASMVPQISRRIQLGLMVVEYTQETTMMWISMVAQSLWGIQLSIGGGIFTHKNTVSFDGSRTFEGNFASENGSGISTKKNSNVNLIQLLKGIQLGKMVVE